MFGIVSRRRYDDARAEAERQRRRADTAEQHKATAVFNRTQVLKQNANADAANRRLHARNLELGRKLSALTESDPEYAASLERRVERLKRVGARILAAYALERHRADHRQAFNEGADHKAITEWEQRVKAHNTWTPPADDEPLIEGAHARPTHPAVVLRRALDRCRALEERLARAEGRRGTVSGS